VALDKVEGFVKRHSTSGGAVAPLVRRHDPPVCGDGSATAVCPAARDSASIAAETGPPTTAARGASHPACPSSVWHVAGPDLRCIADPHFVSQSLPQLHKPLAVARCFQSNPRSHRQLPIPPLRLAVAVLQPLFSGFARLGVAPRHLLPAGMKITSYNPHLKAPSFPASFVLNPQKTSQDSCEPSTLSNQVKRSLTGGFRSYSDYLVIRNKNPHSRPTEGLERGTRQTKGTL
jgi:hypothetical protein